MPMDEGLSAVGPVLDANGVPVGGGGGVDIDALADELVRKGLVAAAPEEEVVDETPPANEPEPDVHSDEAVPDGSPQWYVRQVAKQRQERREAEAKVHALEVKLAELSGRLEGGGSHQAPAVQEEPEPEAYGLGEIPATVVAALGEEAANVLWGALNERVGNATFFTRKSVLDRLNGTQEELRQNLGNIQAREAFREVNTHYEAAMAKYPALKNPDALSMVKAAVHQQYGDKQLTPEVMREIGATVDKLSRQFAAPAPVAPRTPGAGPVAGSRVGGQPTPPAPKPGQSFRSAVSAYAGGVTLNDLMQKR